MIDNSACNGFEGDHSGCKAWASPWVVLQGPSMRMTASRLRCPAPVVFVCLPLKGADRAPQDRERASEYKRQVHLVADHAANGVPRNQAGKF